MIIEAAEAAMAADRLADGRTGQRCWSRLRTIIAVFQTVWNLNYHSLAIRSVAAAVAEASTTTIGEGGGD